MLSELHEELRDAGLPITGLSRSGSDVNINWSVTPTPQQQATAQQIIATFVFDIPDIDYAAELAALTTDQRNTLLRLMMLNFLRSHPRVLERIKNGTVLLNR